VAGQSGVSGLLTATPFHQWEITTMKKLLALIAVLVIAAVAVGFWRGWFTFETAKDEGKVHVDLTVNKEKFKQDKEKLKEKAAERSKAMKEKLAALREKAKGLSADEKAKAGKEIEELSRKHEALEAKIKDLDEAGEEKFEELKKGITGAIEEHSP
jgi:hypothetical protein